jgi:hypothetical protein
MIVEHHCHKFDWLTGDATKCRFEPTEICGECNTAGGLVKAKFQLPEDFSFSPDEIRQFVKCTPHSGKTEIDYEKAHAIYLRERYVVSKGATRKRLGWSKWSTWPTEVPSPWMPLEGLSPIRERNRSIVITDWKPQPHQMGSLQGFFSATFPDGLILHGLTLHRKGVVRWIGLPAYKWGIEQYKNIIGFCDRRTADRFRDAVLAALDKYFDEREKRLLESLCNQAMEHPYIPLSPEDEHE